MHTTTLFPVNLQQGLIVAKGNTVDHITVFAAYSHHLKTIIVIDPWNDRDFEIPPSLKGYTIFLFPSDSISLCFWDNKRSKDLQFHQFIK